MNPKPALLAHVPLFSELAPKELELLSHHLVMKELLAGQVIFRQGEAANSCFIVLDGEIGVYLDDAEDTEAVAILEDGALVGQMALIDGKRRSATCRVVSTTVHVIELRRDDFERLITAQTPFAYKILDKLVVDLVKRLRQTNERLVDARREQNHAAMQKKTREAAARLVGGPKDRTDLDDLDPDSIQVFIPSLEQRMRDRRNK